MRTNQRSIGQRAICDNLLRPAVIVLLVFSKNVWFERALLGVLLKFVLLSALVSSHLWLVKILLDVELLLLFISKLARRHAAPSAFRRADGPHLARKVAWNVDVA